MARILPRGFALSVIVLEVVRSDVGGLLTWQKWKAYPIRGTPASPHAVSTTIAIPPSSCPVGGDDIVDSPEDRLHDEMRTP